MTSKKQSLRDSILLLILLLWALGLFLFGQQVASATASALELCLFVLLPSLFPFLVLSSLLISSGIVTRIAPKLDRPMRVLFDLPGICAAPVLLGMIGGYPVGARAVSDLYQQGLCSFSQAKRLLLFCNNAGPSFFISVIGGGLLHNTKMGVLLWLVHLLAAFIVSLVSFCKGDPIEYSAVSESANVTKPLLPAFLQAVTAAFSSFLNICAFVLIFAVIIRLSIAMPFFYRLCNVMPGSATFWQGLCTGFWELTAGTSMLISGKLPRKLLLATLSFLCGWGGISVQCQSVSLLRESGLPCRNYILSKVFHGLLAGGLTLILGL